MTNEKPLLIDFSGLNFITMSTSYQNERLEDQPEKKYYIKLYFKKCEDFWKSLIIDIIKNRYVERYPRDKRQIIIEEESQRKLLSVINEKVQYRIAKLHACLPDGQKIEMKAIQDNNRGKQTQYYIYRYKNKKPMYGRHAKEYKRYYYRSPPPTKRSPSPRRTLHSHKKAYKTENYQVTESVPVTTVYNDVTLTNSKNYNYDVTPTRSVSPDVSINNSMSWEEEN